MAALGRAYYFCMGFRVVVKGKQVSSSEAPILAVAPHSTFFDGIVCIVAGLPSTVSRVENLATPIFGSETLIICLVVLGQGSRHVPLSQPPACVYLYFYHCKDQFELGFSIQVRIKFRLGLGYGANKYRNKSVCVCVCV